MSARARLAVLAFAGGCAAFEDPVVVLDLRVLAMRAEPPEQVVSIDPDQPISRALLDQLVDTEIVALVADPASSRPLRWSLTACLLDDDGRCDLALPHLDLGRGQLEDPEQARVPQQPLALIAVGDPQTRTTLAAMFLRGLQANPVQALGGIEYAVELRIGALEAPPEEDVVAIKRLRVAPRIPQVRAPNANPRINSLESARNGDQGPIATGIRCATASGAQVPSVPPGGTITLFPVEPPDARQTYDALTLDGQAVTFTETLEYQWLASYGSFSDAFTGGGRDLLGNESLLGSDWRAPRGVTSPLRVSLWGIQRDERYGVSWFETCVVVVP